MGTNRGAIDAVMAAVCHDLCQCDGYGLPNSGFAPPPEPPIDRIPIAVFGRNIAPRRATAKPPEYTVDNCAVPFRPPATTPVRCRNRQQTLQNTPFCFRKIASAQDCLQKAALNQASTTTSTNLSTPPNSVPSQDYVHMIVETPPYVRVCDLCVRSRDAHHTKYSRKLHLFASDTEGSGSGRRAISQNHRATSLTMSS